MVVLWKCEAWGGKDGGGAGCSEWKRWERSGRARVILGVQRGKREKKNNFCVRWEEDTAHKDLKGKGKRFRGWRAERGKLTGNRPRDRTEPRCRGALGGASLYRPGADLSENRPPSSSRLPASLRPMGRPPACGAANHSPAPALGGEAAFRLASRGRSPALGQPGMLLSAK